MKRASTFGIMLLVGMLMPFASVSASSIPDEQYQIAINHYVEAHQGRNSQPLKYPKTVKRFYRSNDHQPAWINGQSTAHVWQALLLLDCVLNYGLNYADYHPDSLTYDLAHEIIEQPAKVSLEKQVAYDVLLTDAMITLINDLHYGKLNPLYSTSKLDAGLGNINTERVLEASLKEKDISGAILEVQPHSADYVAMQHKMNLYKGQYNADCYEIPEADIRKLAINMERLRWAQIAEGPYLQVNIPSHTAELHEKDTVYTFNIIAGIKLTPTASFNGSLKGISVIQPVSLPGEPSFPTTQNSSFIAPSTKTYIHFDHTGTAVLLSSLTGIHLRDHYNKTITTGDIGFVDAYHLATLLLDLYGDQGARLKFNKALRLNKTQTFTLNNSVPLKVTYLTYIVSKGEVLNWPDIYHLDAQLEKALYASRMKTKRPHR